MIALWSAMAADAKSYLVDPAVASVRIEATGAEGEGGGEIVFVPLRLRVTRARFVAEIGMSNATDRWISLRIEDLRCGRGEPTTTFGFPMFGIGERTFDLEPGEKKVTAPLRCGGLGRFTGDLVIRVERLYAAGDAEPASATPAYGPIEWRMAEADLAGAPTE
ncbi:MAG: hypothetical protein ABMB14_26590 [Myxococcota bacterium]